VEKRKRSAFFNREAQVGKQNFDLTDMEGIGVGALEDQGRGDWKPDGKEGNEAVTGRSYVRLGNRLPVKKQ